MKTIQFLLLFLLFFSGKAVKNKFEKLDKYLSGLESKDEFSGYILIAEKDKTVFKKAYGFADMELKIKQSEKKQFQISSTGKLFTGTLIVMLAQQKKLDFQDKVSKYIPGLKFGDEVTIHHLLTHTDGIPPYSRHPKFTYKNVKSCTDIMPFLKESELLFKPGDSAFYSNSSTMVLGAVIEKITGKNYQQYLKETIFEPLKMHNTSFVNNGFVQKLENDTVYSKGYMKDSLGKIYKFRNDEDIFVPLASGGMWCSVEDLLKFDRAIHNGKLINKKYYELMVSPKVFSNWPDCYFAYGWMNINVGKNQAVGHPGNTEGHHNTFYRYKKNNTTIILMTNFGFVDIFSLSAEVEKLVFE